MSLSDIAALAGVQRPVVTMWRKRPRVRGELLPFPRAMTSVNGVERFATREVVAWLERSGRGVNAEFREDALAHSTFPDFGLDPSTAFRGIAGLLALKARTGLQLSATAPDDLLHLADEHDPDDLAFYAEIAALGHALTDIAAYVDRLADAAYDVVGAGARLDQLWHARFGRTGELVPEVLDLGGALAAAMALDLGADSVLLGDPDGQGQSLIAHAVGRLDERIAVSVHVGGTSDGSRWSRRRLMTAGIDLAQVRIAANVPAVGVINVVGCEGSAVDLLTAIDDAHLEFTATQPVIVLGPAALLCDRISDSEARRVREEMFVRGGLRCAIRLPSGLRSDSPRMRLGLWVLAGPQVSVPLGSRWFGASDLGDRALDGELIEAVVTDAVSCVSGQRARGRAFATMRMMRTADVLAESSALVPPGVSARRLPLVDPSSRVVGMRGAQAALSPRPAASVVDSFTIVPPMDTPLEPLTVEQLIDRGDALVRRGSRVSADRLRPDGVVRVFTAADISSRRRVPSDGLGALELATDHPRAHRTEPGDVVFCTSPTPAAVVDRDGGAVACAPIRILRLHPSSGISPHAVAALINSLDSSQKEWRAWQIARSSPQSAARLEVVLRSLEEERDAAQDRARRLAAFSAELAIAHGQMDISLDQDNFSKRDRARASSELTQL